MPSDEDIALDEKRVYAERRAETRAYVAGEMGVAEVAVSDDQVGRFGLVRQCTARDVAGEDGRLLVATDEDVLIASGGEGDADPAFEPTDFGPAVAVGVGEHLLAATPDGTVARLVDDDWEPLAAAPMAAPPTAVHAIDGDLVAADEGVYEAGENLDPVGQGRGLYGVRDVAAAGPDAATVEGVFRLGPSGWRPEVGEEATVVAGDGDRTHAVVEDDLWTRTDEGWRPVDAPEAGVVDVAYGEGTIAVTGDGAVLLDPVSAKDGSPEWRSRSLGLTGVAGVAVP